MARAQLPIASFSCSLLASLLLAAILVATLVSMLLGTLGTLGAVEIEFPLDAPKLEVGMPVRVTPGRSSPLVIIWVPRRMSASPSRI